MSESAEAMPPALRVYANQMNAIERAYRAAVLELQKKRQTEINEAVETCLLAMHDPREDPAT